MSEIDRLLVKITADTRAFEHSLLKVQLIMERRWWKRLWLRFLLWRVAS